MAITLNTTIIEKVEDLYDFIQSFDGDFSGENGDDYLFEEAVEGGFESNTEYSIAEAKKIHGDDLEKIVQFVLIDLEGTYDSGDYIGADSSITPINDGKQLVVTFAYGSED